MYCSLSSCLKLRFEYCIGNLLFHVKKDCEQCFEFDSRARGFGRYRWVGVYYHLVSMDKEVKENVVIFHQRFGG